FGFAILQDQSLWAWGQGALGVGGSGYSPIPEQVPNLGSNRVASIAGGQLHSLLLTTDGSTLATGDDLYGELGNNGAYDNPGFFESDYFVPTSNFGSVTPPCPGRPGEPSGVSASIANNRANVTWNTAAGGGAPLSDTVTASPGGASATVSSLSPWV